MKGIRVCVGTRWKCKNDHEWVKSSAVQVDDVIEEIRKAYLAGISSDWHQGTTAWTAQQFADEYVKRVVEEASK